MVDSAGLLLWRRSPDGDVEILIGHMGGPFWANKTEHSWSIPKGLADQRADGTVEVDLLAVAEREFTEEMGSSAPLGESVSLGSVKASKKLITIFARQGEFDAQTAVSNTFEMEWPRGSGRMQSFPEIDAAAWVTIDEARMLLTKGQQPFLDRLLAHLNGESVQP